MTAGFLVFTVSSQLSMKLRLDLAGQLAANGTIGCSSLNLMLRPYVAVVMIIDVINQMIYRFILWKTWRFICVFLVLATIGHWIFLLRS